MFMGTERVTTHERAFGTGEQIAVTQFHTYNHGLIRG
jgi:hypothetical protein